jgi:hypothetical protein
LADTFFGEVPGRIPFGGPDATEPLAYTVYEPDRVVLGKRMEDHLRIGVCLWHSFAWPGTDMFGMGTFDRPWLAPGLDPYAAARMKVDSAFEFLEKLGVPFFCFHDRDVAPEQGSWKATIALPQRRAQPAHCWWRRTEGAAFGLRDSLDLMIAAGMPAPSQVRASGGGIASALWRQILADVLETELATVSTTEGAASGAAVLATLSGNQPLSDPASRPRMKYLPRRM